MIKTNIEDNITYFCENKWGIKSYEKLANKLAEESGEVCGAVVKIEENRCTFQDLENEIGDVLIVLSQFASKMNLTLEEIRNKRFLEIKNR